MSDGVAWHRRLATRVLFFLTLALVPLGIIGVIQNAELFKSAERRSELSLLALTENAASGERQLIQRAIGAAEALGAMIDTVQDDPEVCSAYLRRYLTASDNFAFVGFIPPDGVTVCSTADSVLDVSGYENFADLVANPRPNIEVNTAAPASGQSVMILNHPRIEEGEFQGYVSLSIPLEDVGASQDFLGEADPISLITFNMRGEILSAENGRVEAGQKIPADIPLSTLAQGDARTFIARNSAGLERVYAVIPIVPDVVYALSSWRIDGPSAAGIDAPRFNVLLPLLMWAASLLVAWFVIDRLLINRIGDLSTAVQRFARDRTMPKAVRNRAFSSELTMLEDAVVGMAEDLLQDEAQQEARLREKSILLKEVHHRVKNNLQIISSIMNMQIRKASAPETKRALSQVQDRIIGLSGVHRTLYQATNLNQINAADLIEQIVGQSRAIGGVVGVDVQIETALDPVIVYPDQAVPLSMLVAEALTNAIKYIGSSDGTAPKLSILLELDSSDNARLLIENSRSAPDPASQDIPSTGLGKQLIRAFATQLDGRLEIVDQPELYRIDVTFKVEDFKDETIDL